MRGIWAAPSRCSAASTPQIGVRALKAAEDGDGYIVRCYETMGNPVEGARITFPAAIVSAEECNGIEERIGDAAFEGRSLVVSAGKFAPKTYRVRLAEPAVRSTLAIDNAPVKLDYDITAYTTDEFFTYYTIDKALGSFAAELIPATVECDGVTFAMGEANTDDAVLCNGQTVALPADRTYTKLYVLASGCRRAAHGRVPRGRSHLRGRSAAVERFLRPVGLVRQQRGLHAARQDRVSGYGTVTRPTWATFPTVSPTCIC